MAPKMSLTVAGIAKNFKTETLKVYADLIATDNVGAKGLQAAVTKAGGESFAASLLADNKNPDDIFEVTREFTVKGKNGIVTGTITRARLAARILVALTADTFATTIVRVVDGKTEEDEDSAEFTMEIA